MIKQDDELLHLLVKGDAIKSAMDCGLIQKTENGYDDGPFNEFWDKWSEALIRQMIKADRWRTIALFSVLVNLICIFVLLKG